MSFSARSAVIYHDLAGVDPAVFAILKAEEALLIHSCTASATTKTKEWVNTAGVSVLRIDTEPTLSWAVTASVISQSGLANYHPGRALSDRGLIWANSSPIPFQFRETADSVYIYEAPTLIPAPGDIPAIRFSVRLQFAELDTTTYPTTNPGPGGGDPEDPPASYVTLPVQDYVALLPTAVNALLEDLWYGTDVLGPEDFDLTFFDADPLTTGNAITDAYVLDAWTTPTDATADPSAITALIENGGDIYVTDTSATERVATHIRFRRGASLPVAVVELAVPLVIPPYSGVFIGAGSLVLALTYPFDTDSAPGSSSRPARLLLKYLAGGDRATYLPSTTLTVYVYTGDPATGGTLIDSWTETSNIATWDVVDDTVAPASTIDGTNTAPGGGWSVGWVRIQTSLNAVILDEEIDPPLAITPGGIVSLTVAEFTLDLAAAPD